MIRIHGCAYPDRQRYVSLLKVKIKKIEKTKKTCDSVIIYIQYRYIIYLDAALAKHKRLHYEIEAHDSVTHSALTELAVVTLPHQTYINLYDSQV